MFDLHKFAHFLLQKTRQAFWEQTGEETLLTEGISAEKKANVAAWKTIANYSRKQTRKKILLKIKGDLYAEKVTHMSYSPQIWLISGGL